MKRRTFRRVFAFTRKTRNDVRGDVHEEFQFHIDERTNDLVRAGLTDAEARAQARREFGDVTAGAAGCAAHDDRVERRRRLGQFAGELKQDVTLGIRLIVRNPWFSTAAILTLAVAIGGNTAIFSVLNALLFKPLPVAASHELARIRAGQSQISWLNYRDITERNQVFAATVAQRRLLVALATDGAPAKLWGEQTTANYFTVLGVPAALGRTYTPADTRRDVVVLAHHAWQARFGGDPAIVGRLLTLNGRAHEVLGVMPRGFRGVAPAGLLQDAWLPIDPTAPSAMLTDRAATEFEMFARLAPGITRQQAESALRVLGRQLRADHPEVPESVVQMLVFPVDGIGAFRGMADLIIPVLGFLTLMSLVAGLILLIGCANIAGLLMGRAAARRKEIAMRLALGAGRGRLVRQLLTESLVLAVAGGGAGMLLAIWLTNGVNPFLSRAPLPMEFDLHLDTRVLAYVLAASMASAVIFGLSPARRASRMDLVSSLKDEGSGGVVRQRLRRGLVVGQVAACSVLLIWSGLFLRSLGTIATIDPGFDPDGVVLARIQLDRMNHDRAFGERLFLDLEQEVEEAAPVESAGLATVVPLSLENEEFDVIPEKPGTAPARRRVMANRLTPGWFGAVRIPIVNGRDFRPDDRDGAPLVAIVNETLAQEWNGQAVGKLLQIPGSERTVEIVGVVRDSKYWTLGEAAAPTLYLPFRQAYAEWMTLHARTSDMRRTTEVISQFVQHRAPDVFVEISPMSQTVATAMIPARVGAAVTTAFTVVAMLLASLGVYGLVAFSVAQRMRELGVRKAIGATTTDLIRLVVGENIAWTMTGLAAGAVVGVLGATVLRTFIAGVSPFDPITLAGTAVLIGGATLVASAIPAMRAAVVNPLIVLRDS